MKKWKYIVIGVLPILVILFFVLFLDPGLSDDDKVAAATLVSFNDRIDFYGKVIDQYGPVEGVEVIAEVSGWNRGFLKGKKGLRTDGKLVLHTDVNGRFSIENQDGTILEFDQHSFHKDGYIFPRWNYGGRYHYGSYYHEHEQHHPDPDQPVIFPLWQRLPPEERPRALIKRSPSYGPGLELYLRGERQMACQ